MPSITVNTKYNISHRLNNNYIIHLNVKLSKLHVNEKEFLIYSTYIVLSSRHREELAAILVCINRQL